MTVDDLLNTWVEWSRYGGSVLRSPAKHPLSKLMDGLAGVSVCCSAVVGRSADDDAAAQVEMAVAKLPRKQKAVILAEYLKTGEREEKAEDLGMTCNAYYVALHRAKNNLSLTLKHLLN